MTLSSIWKWYIPFDSPFRVLSRKKKKGGEIAEMGEKKRAKMGK